MHMRTSITLLTILAIPILIVSAQVEGKKPAPKPAPAKTNAAGKLAVEAGPVTLRKKAATTGGKPATATEQKIVKGLTADLETKETAVVGEAAKAVAKFGGCKITLMENTNFELLEVGEEASIVEILGVEMELERGTELEAEFGSLKVNLSTGSFKANPAPGVVTTLRIVTAAGKTLNFTLQAGTTVNLVRGADGQMIVSVPPGTPDVTMTVTTTDDSGNEVTTTPTTFAAGTSSNTNAVVGGSLTFSASESKGPGRSSPTEIVQAGSRSAARDQPPVGTVVGSLPLSSGLGQ